MSSGRTVHVRRDDIRRATEGRLILALDLSIEVVVRIKRGTFDSIASNTITAPLDADARVVAEHVEKTVEDLRQGVATFASIASKMTVEETD